MFMLSGSLSSPPGVLCTEPEDQREANPAAPVSLKMPIDATSIIHLTAENNPGINAARYALEVAEFQFQDFERALSQFTPLIARTNIERDERQPHENQDYSVQMGMEKDFFSGSSVFAGVGHSGDFGDDGEGNSNFVKMDMRFPLFSSNTALRRITQRSREENELFNARLEYVDKLRNVIQDTQENYFWLLVNWERHALIVRCASDYQQLLSIPRLRDNPLHRQQVEDELLSLRSEILQREEGANSLLLALQLALGMDDLPASLIRRMNLYSENYYGKHYLLASPEILLEKARQNDIRVRVLRNARENSEEKKRLAEQGKWDIFVDLEGQYDFESSGDWREESGYSVGVGFSVRKIDSTLQSISFRRAEAEIKRFDAEIRGQQLATANRIDREWFKTVSRRSQCEELFDSVASRRMVFLQKRKDYASGRESIDNLIQARKNLLDSELELIDGLGECCESITKLDHACGVYFPLLGVDINSGQVR